ncbi:MAG: DUF1800 family protein [Pseudomonadota bacterium]
MSSPSLARLRPLCLGIAAAAALAACGRAGDPASTAPHAATGQVRPVTSAAVSRYAAARFADQVSFGATPALIDDIASKGFEGWIDAQFALPVVPINAAPIKLDSSNSWPYASRVLHEKNLVAPDQLRQRVTWSLSQFIVVSMRKINPYGGLQYANLLQQHALGNYATLIEEVSLSPAMGEYLDNIQNRPTSDECRSCAPNENYARELMQLFTVGVVKLNIDGSVQRAPDKTPLETYQQKDVQELARALTGWTYGTESFGDDQGRYEGKLVPDSWDATHDKGAKTVLGTVIPAGGNAAQDLRAAVAVLAAHPNMAPFVSIRLIQHLVTSDPTPAYITRVASVFNNNGQGVRGDMKAVVKAILLDPEARRGDVLGADSHAFGKMREPFLWYTGLLRGMGCTTALKWNDGGIANVDQMPYNPESVFSFYAPTDRAPGSNLLAPEQRLLNASELSNRLGGMTINKEASAIAAGCDSAGFARAFSTSPQAFADLVSERYFRGAMPVVLRQNLIDLAPEIWGDTPHEKAARLLLYALATPYYGVIR